MTTFILTLRAIPIDVVESICCTSPNLIPICCKIVSFVPQMGISYNRIQKWAFYQISRQKVVWSPHRGLRTNMCLLNWHGSISITRSISLLLLNWNEIKSSPNSLHVIPLIGHHNCFIVSMSPYLLYCLSVHNLPNKHSNAVSSPCVLFSSTWNGSSCSSSSYLIFSFPLSIRNRMNKNPRVFRPCTEIIKNTTQNKTKWETSKGQKKKSNSLIPLTRCHDPDTRWRSHSETKTTWCRKKVGAKAKVAHGFQQKVNKNSDHGYIWPFQIMVIGKRHRAAKQRRKNHKRLREP